MAHKLLPLNKKIKNSAQCSKFDLTNDYPKFNCRESHLAFFIYFPLQINLDSYRNVRNKNLALKKSYHADHHVLEVYVKLTYSDDLSENTS